MVQSYRRFGKIVPFLFALFASRAAFAGQQSKSAAPSGPVFNTAGPVSLPAVSLPSMGVSIPNAGISLGVSGADVSNLVAPQISQMPSVGASLQHNALPGVAPAAPRIQAASSPEAPAGPGANTSIEGAKAPEAVRSASERSAEPLKFVGENRGSSEDSAQAGRDLESALTGEKRRDDGADRVYAGRGWYVRARALGMPAPLPNPSQYYADAFEIAALELGKQGLAREDVRFGGVTGSIPAGPRGHLNFAFFGAKDAGAKTAPVVYVDYAPEWSVVSGLMGSRVSGSRSPVPVSGTLFNGVNQPYYFARGSQLGPDAALDAARAVLSELSPSASFSLRYEKDEKTGDLDAIYRFYDSRGNQASVNARTGAALAVERVPDPALTPEGQAKSARRELSIWTATFATGVGGYFVMAGAPFLLGAGLGALLAGFALWGAVKFTEAWIPEERRGDVSSVGKRFMLGGAILASGWLGLAGAGVIGVAGVAGPFWSYEPLPNPADHYADAYEQAVLQAEKLGYARADVRLDGITGGVSSRIDGRLYFTFFAQRASARTGAIITVDYSRGFAPAGRLDSKLRYIDGTTLQARPATGLEPSAAFSAAVKIPAEQARDIAKANLAGLSYDSSFGLAVEPAASGAAALWYSFHDSRGNVVKVGAATGEVVVAAREPQKAPLTPEQSALARIRRNTALGLSAFTAAVAALVAALGGTLAFGLLVGATASFGGAAMAAIMLWQARSVAARDPLFEKQAAAVVKGALLAGALALGGWALAGASAAGAAGAGAVGMAGITNPYYNRTPLPNPSEYYADAYEYAVMRAEKLGYSREQVRFGGVTGTLPVPADRHLMFTFYAVKTPGAKTGAAIYVDYAPRFAAPGRKMGSVATAFADAPLEGPVFDGLNSPAEFAAAAKIAPEQAFDIAKANHAYLSYDVSFKQTVERSPSGALAPWYSFYDSKGNQVKVSAATGEVVVAAREPGTPKPELTPEQRELRSVRRNATWTLAGFAAFLGTLFAAYGEPFLLGVFVTGIASLAVAALGALMAAMPWVNRPDRKIAFALAKGALVTAAISILLGMSAGTAAVAGGAAMTGMTLPTDAGRRSALEEHYERAYERAAAEAAERGYSPRSIRLAAASERRISRTSISEMNFGFVVLERASVAASIDVSLVSVGGAPASVVVREGARAASQAYAPAAPEDFAAALKVGGEQARSIARASASRLDSEQAILTVEPGRDARGVPQTWYRFSDARGNRVRVSAATGEALVEAREPEPQPPTAEQVQLSRLRLGATIVGAVFTGLTTLAAAASGGPIAAGLLVGGLVSLAASAMAGLMILQLRSFEKRDHGFEKQAAAVAKGALLAAGLALGGWGLASMSTAGALAGGAALTGSAADRVPASVTDAQVEAAAKGVVFYKGGTWSHTEYNMSYSNTLTELERRGATPAQLAKFRELCDQAPIKGGRFNPWSGD